MLGSLPPATRAIILICVAVFLLQQVINLEVPFALWPLGTLFKPWQVVTYAFLHDPKNWMHIFFNMFALFMFGGLLERYWGSARFTIYFMVCVVAAAATQLAVQHGTDAIYPTVGASGGVFGLLLAFAIYFPQQRVFVLPIPIPLPAWLFVTLYGAVELFLGVTGTQSAVAHFAHLGGMLGGAAMLLYWRRNGQAI
jgi:membrane associated rhomboid family serine protease